MALYNLLDQVSKIYDPIENFIYLYHTDTLIILPNYPKSLSESLTPSFSPTSILGRSAPTFSYTGTGARSMLFLFELHRDMLQQVNLESNSHTKPDGYDEDYVDLLVKVLLAASLPNYAASLKMIDPPLAMVRIGQEVFIKGVVTSCTIGYSGALLRDKYDENKMGHYSLVSVGFNISETNPYDAETVLRIGSFRCPSDIQINTSLDSRTYTVVTSSGTSHGYTGVGGGGGVRLNNSSRLTY